LKLFLGNQKNREKIGEFEKANKLIENFPFRQIVWNLSRYRLNIINSYRIKA
jgi:hypothetical protein